MTDLTSSSPAAAQATRVSFEHRDQTGMDSAFVESFTRHINRHRTETHPDDPPVLAEELMGQLAHLPPIMTLDIWSVPSQGGLNGAADMQAHAFLQRMSLDTNQHLCELEIVVEPQLRRQGIGRELLRQAVQLAHEHGRTHVMISTNDRVPAGEPFLARFGFTKGLENRTNQLTLSELPAGLLEAWTTRPDDRYRLEVWQGDIPEKELEAFALLSNVMNSAPHDDLEIEDFHLTPELLRQQEAMRRAGNREALIAVVRSPAGELVGLSELTWRVNQPQIVSQGGTGVLPEHRGHGLGRWLKAANLQHLLQVNPQARFIRTGNANSNAPMLKINTDMGFKLYMASTIWQAETAGVLERMKE